MMKATQTHIPRAVEERRPGVNATLFGEPRPSGTDRIRIDFGIPQAALQAAGLGRYWRQSPKAWEMCPSTTCISSSKFDTRLQDNWKALSELVIHGGCGTPSTVCDESASGGRKLVPTLEYPQSPPNFRR